MTEVIKEWEQDGVVMHVVRFRIGVLKGKLVVLAAIITPRNPKEIQIDVKGWMAKHHVLKIYTKLSKANLTF